MTKRGLLNGISSLILVAFVADSLTGCSVVRSIEISARHRAEMKVIKTETRKIPNIVRKDVQMGFYPTHEGLGLHLQYVPHYEVQSRSIIQYSYPTSGMGSETGPLILGLGLFEFIMFMTAIFTLPTESGATYGDYENDPVDWSAAAAAGNTAFIIGIPLDAMLWFMLETWAARERHTPWRLSNTAPGTPKPISNHSLSINLSFPLFQYRYQDTYHTNSDGKFTIPAHELIGKIPNLEPVLRTSSIKIDASAIVDDKEQQQSFAITRFRDGQRDPLFAIFREQAALRQEKPADLVTQLAFSDEGDINPNNILDAGERRGKLKITVKNKGQGPGLDVQLHLSSDNPDIQLSKTQTLGRIEPNGEKTVVVPITTNLQASDGVANILIEARERRGYDAQKQQNRIRVAGLKPPRLTMTGIEVNDKTLGNAVGNGNGIPENAETIELNVFIKNSGTGNALGAKLELVSLNRGLDVQVRSANLGTIHPTETIKGVLRFRIPRTFAAETLNYKLRVTDVRGADSTEKVGALRMETQLPILTYDISSPSGITNGASASFTITPRNAGKLRARNVALRLSTRNATIDPASVDLGTLEAGRSFPPQPFTVTLPRTFKANQLALNIQLSQTEFDGLSRTENYPVRHITPSLEITDTLVADTNGDGNIQQGKRVEFEVRVINKGELNAENTRLKVSVADTRIRIDTPERLLGGLAPNFTSNPERFAFTLPRAVPAGALPITVEVMHKDFPDEERIFEYQVYAEGVQITTETPGDVLIQPGTPTRVIDTPPVIVVKAPGTDTHTVYSPNFTLEASVSDNRGLDGVRVRLNDERIYDSQTAPDATQQLKTSNRRLLSFDVPLPLREGANRVVITARDNNYEQTHQSISLIYERKVVPGLENLENYSDVDVDIPQGSSQNPDAVALVIGIGHYRDVADATYADQDAIVFSEYLKRSFGYSPDRIELLTNDRATEGDIKRGLEKVENLLKLRSNKGDVIVFYAGHGIVKNNSQYLIPFDADPNNPAGYPLEEFYQKLSQLKAKSVTVFMDACFSGRDREAREIIKGARSLGLPEMKFPKSSVPVLASSTGNQISSSYKTTDTNKYHGLFTYYLLKGLRGAADGADGSRRNRAITLSELEAYTKKHVSETALEKLGRTQEPTLTGSREERVLLKIQQQ